MAASLEDVVEETPPELKARGIRRALRAARSDYWRKCTEQHMRIYECLCLMRKFISRLISGDWVNKEIKMFRVLVDDGLFEIPFMKQMVQCCYVHYRRKEGTDHLLRHSIYMTQSVFEDIFDVKVVPDTFGEDISVGIIRRYCSLAFRVWPRVLIAEWAEWRHEERRLCGLHRESGSPYKVWGALPRIAMAEVLCQLKGQRVPDFDGRWNEDGCVRFASIVEGKSASGGVSGGASGGASGEARLSKRERKAAAAKRRAAAKKARLIR